MNNREVKVSVVIPAFNASAYIKSTIESVLNQSMTDFEIIIVDDWSDDYSELEKLIAELDDQRVKLYRLEQKGNGAVARNKGVALSSGNVIAFLDADDLWHPNKLSTQLSMLEPGIVVSCASKVQFREGGEENVVSEYKPELNVSHNLFGALRHNLVLQTSTIMLYKSDFERSGGYDERLGRHQDFQLVFSLENSGCRFKVCDQVLSYYIKSRATDVNKKWSIENSSLFLSHYACHFDRITLRNFLVVQLFGPSLKTQSLSKWLELARHHKVGYLSLVSCVIRYVLTRLWNK
ncbi:glycosyltransferase family 2 protein [Vibrio rotiferianus]|uniref:glycosyltransferase family 2 protein n=1 Tax=Vibrio rotiferianus TaxID=190895 RepID=UPI00406A40C2